MALCVVLANPAGAQEPLPNLEGSWHITNGRILCWDGSAGR